MNFMVTKFLMLMGQSRKDTSLCLYRLASATHFHSRKNENFFLNISESSGCVSPLHIELGLMKILVKELDRDRHALAYLRNQFPKLSEPKQKERMFIGSLIREVIHNPDSL